MNKLTGWDDTIVALATPPGVGAIGVLRISGRDAFRIVNDLFPSRDLESQPSHTIHVGLLKEGDKVLDEVVVSLFKGPRSYTGEDVVEIGCHGSPFVQQEVMHAIVRKGARLARAGEFTQRAFLNGKLDLAQAEAVADLIVSNTTASQKAALHTMRGGFSENLKALREKLLEFSALIELELDFSQEDVEFADRKKFYALIDELSATTGRLVESFRLGNVVKNGVGVAIIGKPNAGKSTLLNSLLNENRAIVSDIPGTTRDTIEEALNIDGIIFRLTDTAGLRSHTSDVVESAGIARSLVKMEESDLVIYLFDVADDPAEVLERKKEFDKSGFKYLLVANKVDRTSVRDAHDRFANLDVTYISAKEHLHLDQLKERMVAQVMEGRVQTEGSLVTNARHYHALKEVQQSLSAIRGGLDNHLPGDLLASDIRRCLHFLGEITGEITNEEQLGYIFGRFCIGK